MINEKLIPKTNYVIMKPTADQTLSTTEQKVNLNQVSKVGNKLSVSNNQCVIGTGVSKIKISGAFYLQTGGDNQYEKICYIYKNSTWVARANTHVNHNYQHLKIPAFILDVQQGDKIDMRAKTNTTASVTGMKVPNSANNFDTYMMVEVIN